MESCSVCLFYFYLFLIQNREREIHIVAVSVSVSTRMSLDSGEWQDDWKLRYFGVSRNELNKENENILQECKLLDKLEMIWFCVVQLETVRSTFQRYTDSRYIHIILTDCCKQCRQQGQDDDERYHTA